ncbi:MAG: hypothetical protein Q9187_007179 [Circinaria calcarea]
MPAENIVPVVPNQAGAPGSASSLEKILLIQRSGNNTSSREDDQPQIEIATLSPPVGQFVISTILNVAGFAATIAFGVFAIRSVSLAIASNNAAHEGNTYASKANDLASSANAIAAMANDQSVIANQLALIGLCLSNQENLNTSACTQILQKAPYVLPSAASKLNLLTITASPPAASSTSPANDTRSFTRSITRDEL